MLVFRVPFTQLGSQLLVGSRNDLGIEILVDPVSTRLSDQAKLFVVPKTGQTFADLPGLTCDSSGMLERSVGKWTTRSLEVGSCLKAQ